MDERTLQVLKIIKSHSKIKNYLSVLCYFAIISGLFLYVFYALSKSNNAVKVIKQYNKNPEQYKIEKVMTNPRMIFQHENGQFYNIKAKKAHHVNEEEVTLYDVFATGEAGNITAGKLEVSEQGDHLIFSGHPFLILNQTENLNNKKNDNEQ